MSSIRVDTNNSTDQKNGLTNNSAKIYESSMGEGLMTLQKFDLLRAVLIVVISIIGTWGVSSNVINIHVFSKIGLKDSVTLAFVYQSVFDLSTLVLTLVSMASATAELLETYLYPPLAVSTFHHLSCQCHSKKISLYFVRPHNGIPGSDAMHVCLQASFFQEHIHNY